MVKELFGIYHWADYNYFFEEVIEERRETVADKAGFKVRAFVAKLFADIGVAANIIGLEEAVREDATLLHKNTPVQGSNQYRAPLVTIDGGSNLRKAFEARY